ncbi:MAG TPA: cellulose synthase catalytic subunit [Streptosporangiaceae bacterium]|nr:cellulose synthase catalytic subunit [Streptosporangiaceae bacterium]
MTSDGYARESAAEVDVLRPPSGPRPPTDSELTSYIRGNAAVIINTSVASSLCLTVSQLRFVAVSWMLWFLAPYTAFTIAYFLISVYVNAGTRDYDLRGHRQLEQSYRPAVFPALDVFLPICNEPLDVLHNTWHHVAELARAYQGVVTVHVLDDGANPDCGKMAADLGFEYHVRPNRGWFKKAGNLHYGFANSTGEFILILDADFAPRADLPLHILPYFEADPTLGIVQSPQFFRTLSRHSWMERGAGAVQELFYRLIQVSRNRHNAAICVGSCAIYRRAALDANGGTTLIEHSEDVHTGFDLRRKGWGLHYLPMPLATGLCPSDPDSFVAQQYRWCAGSMSLLGSRKFWQTKLPLRTRCCYISGFCYYVHTAIFTFVAPVIPLILLLALPANVRLINYAFVFPSVLYSTVVFPMWHRCRFGPEALMTKLLYGWAHVMALWDITRRKRMGWQPTGSVKKKSKTRRVWVGIAVWNGGTGLLWVAVAGWRMLTMDATTFFPMFALGAFALTITAMALASPRNHLRALARNT